MRQARRRHIDSRAPRASLQSKNHARQRLGYLLPSMARKMEAVGLPSQVFFTLPTIVWKLAKSMRIRAYEHEIAILKADLHKFVPFIRPSASGLNYARFTRSYIINSTRDMIPEELQRLVQFCHKGKSGCE